MITLGVPVLEKKELTAEFVQSIVDTIANPADFHLVIIDNNSEDAYDAADYIVPFKLTVKRYDVNMGFYYPLLDLYNEYGNSDQIGLCHNDIFFYEKGWDTRLKNAFISDAKLDLIGLCGSWVVDIHGGRGVGTTSNFKGIKGAQAGLKSDSLEPAILLDSLFMMFRTPAIPDLEIDENITPCHFYDKIWSMRMVEKGHHVAVLGIEIDHMGGTTSCSPRYQEDAKRWCKEHGFELEKQEDGSESGDLTLYHVGERRFLQEFREEKKIIPSTIDKQYQVWRI